MGPIEQQARQLVNRYFTDYLSQPASLSGRFHKGENMGDHMNASVLAMELLCEGMGVPKEDRDMLNASAYLHDVGKFVIAAKGKVEMKGWKHHEATNWSRFDEFMNIHPILSAAVIDRFDKLDRKEEIKRLVAVHMGPWYKRTPKPEGLYETLIVLADYLSYRVYDVLKKEKEDDKSGTSENK